MTGKVLAIILTVALILCLAGCETTADANEYQRFTHWSSNLSITVDKETGVNYIVYLDHRTGSGICPRYNADGTLYVSEVE